MRDVDDIMAAHHTHCNRLSSIMKSLYTDKEKVRLLHQLFNNTLVYSGYDIQAQDFADEHNRVFQHLNETLEQIVEVLEDLGNDSQRIYEWYIESLDELKEEFRKLR